MSNISTFEAEGFWPHLERERSRVIDTQKRNYTRALSDLRDSIEKNNDEQQKNNKRDADSAGKNKKEIAGKLREVEKFITPKAPQLVKKGLSDLRVYLGKRLTVGQNTW